MISESIEQESLRISNQCEAHAQKAKNKMGLACLEQLDVLMKLPHIHKRQSFKHLIGFWDINVRIRIGGQIVRHQVYGLGPALLQTPLAPLTSLQYKACKVSSLCLLLIGVGLDSLRLSTCTDLDDGTNPAHRGDHVDEQAANGIFWMTVSPNFISHCLTSSQLTSSQEGIAHKMPKILGQRS